jgi:SAM-dependent methyltransferase
MIDPAVVERDKYNDIWSVPDYVRAESPGVLNVERFLKIVKPKPGYSVVDLGCGSGQAGLMLRDAKLHVTWLDITDAALLPDVPRECFIEAPLWQVSGHRDYGFCVDVMEHIPTEYVMLTLDRIVRVCATSFFSIALRPDVFGQIIGQPLHLTVRDFIWWRDRLAAIGKLVDARDLCGDGLFVCNRA